MSDQNPNGQDSNEPEHEEPIIRDKRRIDPETGKVRQPADGSEGASSDVPSDPTSPTRRSWTSDRPRAATASSRS